MKCLIRFEDKYGMYDIYCMLNGLIPYKDEGVHVVNESLVLQNGLSIYGIFNVDRKLKKVLKDNGIEKIVFIFDVDNISGDKSRLITSGQLQRKIQEVREKLREYNLELIFLPVVYAAETIALYAYTKTDYVLPEKVVLPENTNEFQLSILAYLSKRSLRDAKKFREYLNIHKLKEGLDRCQIDTFLNYELKVWIKDSCHLPSLKEVEDVIVYIEKVQEYFEDACKLASSRCMQIQGREISLEQSLREIKDFIFNLEYNENCRFIKFI